jgi:hypothetical protein
MEVHMHQLQTTTFAALLLGSTLAVPAFAANPAASGCPTTNQSADSGGGEAKLAMADRKASGGGEQGPGWQTYGKQQAEAGGGATVASAARKTDGEQGPGWQTTGKQQAEAGGSATVASAARKTDGEQGPGWQTTGKQQAEAGGSATVASADPCH